MGTRKRQDLHAEVKHFGKSNDCENFTVLNLSNGILADEVNFHFRDNAQILKAAEVLEKAAADLCHLVSEQPDVCRTDGEAQGKHEHGVSDCKSPNLWRDDGIHSPPGHSANADECYPRCRNSEDGAHVR